MLKNKSTLAIYKILFGLLGFSSIIIEIAVLLERGTFNPVYFFSYFTIQTNTLVAATFFLSAIGLFTKRSARLAIWRTILTVYILVVGIGFAVLLAGIDGAPPTAIPWNNTVLHYIIPLAVLIDFLLDRPRNIIFSLKRAIIWTLYPLLYVACSLVRGAITGWYPYPFLNPAIKGFTGVALTIIGLLVLTLGLIWATTKLSNKKTL